MRITKKLGLLLMMVSLVALSLPAPIILAQILTTVEVNEGTTITINPGDEIVANAGYPPASIPATGIPVDIKDIVVSPGATGLSGLEFILNWDANVIHVDSLKLSYDANDNLGWGLTVGAIDNVGGSVTYICTTTQEPYSAANLNILLIGITAVGSYGDSTTLTVTVTDLIDDERVTIPTTTVNALIEIPLGTAVTPPVTPSVTPPVTPPVPAAFTTSGLSISPSDVSVGERVTISSLITNTAELSGSYTASLKINNVVVDTKDVTLEGGVSQTVTFTVTQDVAGTYAVIVGTQSGTFNVTAPPSLEEEAGRVPPSSEKEEGGVSPSLEKEEGGVLASIAWWIWLIAGLVVIVITGAGWFVIRNR
ncbi:CARDB domain-containing protein [Chloroflexota bacterium]